MNAAETIGLLEAELNEIWSKPPEEIVRLGAGKAHRPTGSRGQYLTPIMFAEGSMRNFADEVLWCTIGLCRRADIDLSTLIEVTCELSRRKSEFCVFIDLQHVAQMIDAYIVASRQCQDIDEYERLTRAALLYVTRVHVWLDAAFPWSVCDPYKSSRPLRPTSQV